MAWSCGRSHWSASSGEPWYFPTNGSASVPAVPAMAAWMYACKTSPPKLGGHGGAINCRMPLWAGPPRSYNEGPAWVSMQVTGEGSEMSFCSSIRKTECLKQSRVLPAWEECWYLAMLKSLMPICSIASTNLKTSFQRPDLLQVEMADAKQTLSSFIPETGIWNNKWSANCHYCPVSHADSAAPQATLSGMILASPIWANSVRDLCHWLPFSQALRIAL